MGYRRETFWVKADERFVFCIGTRFLTNVARFRLFCLGAV